MKNLVLDPYVKDTVNNLKNVFGKLPISLDQQVKVMNFFQWNLEKDLVIFIWWSQISWSLSPFMHNYTSFLQKADIAYILFDITKEEFNIKNILDYIENKTRIVWANVTMPYKIEVYEILKERNCLDKSAILAWAVNTIAKQEWKIIWYNTDLDWITIPIIDNIWSKKISEKWYVLWAWWASRAVIWWLLKLWVNDITVFNRSEANLNETINHFSQKEVIDILKELWNTDFIIKKVIYDVEKEDSNIEKHIDKNWILVNTLPFWFKENLPKYPIKHNELGQILDKIELYFDIVYDINYKETPMQEYISNNFKKIMICDWVDMVVSQAKKWFELRTDWFEFNEKIIKNIINKFKNN